MARVYGVREVVENGFDYLEVDPPVEAAYTELAGLFLRMARTIEDFSRRNQISSASSGIGYGWAITPGIQEALDNLPVELLHDGDGGGYIEPVGYEGDRPADIHLLLANNEQAANNLKTLLHIEEDPETLLYWNDGDEG